MRNSRFEVYVEVSRWKCITMSFGMNQERVWVRSKDFKAIYFSTVDEIVNTNNSMQRGCAEWREKRTENRVLREQLAFKRQMVEKEL